MPVAPRRDGRRRRPVQGRSQATVEYILEAAAHVFEARGYAATTNQIAERAGVSIGSLYQYFADKDALLVALAERHLAQARRTLRAALADGPAEGPGTTDGLVRRVIDAVIEVNNPSRLHEVLYSAAPRTPGLTAALHSLRDELADLVAALLLTETSDDEGAVRATRRARVLVTAVDAVIHEEVLTAPTPEERTARTDDVVLLVLASLDAFGARPAAG